MEGIVILLIMLAVFACEVFLFRNVMMNYKDCSGYKLLFLIIFSVITAVCAVAVILEGYGLFANTKALNSGNLTKDMISSLKYEIASEKRSTITGSITGITSFILSLLAFLLIKKEWKRELNKPKKKWDLNNIK